MSNVDLIINPITNQPISITLTPKASKGDDGAPGPSGVYLGSEEPTDPDVNVWIDPEGEESSITASDIPVADVYDHYTADPKNTETIFAEVGNRMEAVEQAVQSIPAGTASTTTLTDTANYYTSDNVEGALAEVGAKLIPFYSKTTYNANKSVTITAVDIDTETFTAVGHGFTDGNLVYPTLNWGEEWQQYLPNVLPAGMTPVGYYIRQKTDDTFKLATTNSDTTIINITSAGDITKWHLERLGQADLTISIPSLSRFKIVITGKSLLKAPSFARLTFNALGNISTWMGTTAIGQANQMQPNNNANVYLEAVITVDSSGALKVWQDGYAYGTNTASANANTATALKQYNPSISATVITQVVILNQSYANGTILEVVAL